MLMSACTEHREGVEDVGPFPAALGSDQTACPGTPVLAWWPISKNKSLSGYLFCISTI